MMLGKPPEKESPILLFSSPPNFEELCAISLVVTNPHNIGASRNQAQILKCRELIFTEPNIIATPSFGDDPSITLILQKSLQMSGRLQARFQKIGLKASNPGNVTPALYQACLTYTLLAKLAPSWNKSDQWLLQGRNFLTNTGCISAVKMSLTVTSNDVNMTLEAAALRTSPVQLQDLNLTRSIQHEFLSEPFAVIPESCLMNTWCHVLPSMKKGKIVSVNKVIPDDSPFKTYRDFKRHWKNTYGYRLPDTEENMLYYQIHFKPIGNTLFTYPDVCIRMREFHFLPRVDPKSILACFLQDVREKIPIVCGQSLNFQPKAKYATLGLRSASENLSQPNLTNRIPRLHYSRRDPMMLQNVYQTSRMQEENKTNSAINKFDSKQHQPQPLDSSIMNSAGKIVPIFRSRAASSNHMAQVKPVSKKLTPIFKLNRTVTQANNQTVSCLRDTHQNIPNSDTETSNNRPAAKNLIMCSYDNSITGYQQGISSTGHEKAELYNPRRKLSISDRGFSNFDKLETVAPVLFERQIPVEHSAPKLQLTKQSRIVPVQHPFLIEDNLRDEDFQLPCPVTPLITTNVISKSATNSAKRKSSLPSLQEADSTVIKRPRSKPQVQDGIDIELAAKSGQLSKVNAVTLTAWLKEHNIPCKAKDKKTDLVDKVKRFLCLSGAES